MTPAAHIALSHDHDCGKEKDRSDEAEHGRVDTIALNLANIGKGQYGVTKAREQVVIRGLLHLFEVAALRLRKDVVLRVGDGVKDPVMGFVVADVKGGFGGRFAVDVRADGGEDGAQADQDGADFCCHEDGEEDRVNDGTCSLMLQCDGSHSGKERHAETSLGVEEADSVLSVLDYFMEKSEPAIKCIFLVRWKLSGRGVAGHRQECSRRVVDCGCSGAVVPVGWVRTVPERKMRPPRMMSGKKLCMWALPLMSALMSTLRMQGQTAPPEQPSQTTPSVDMQRSEKVQQRIPQQVVAKLGALQGIVMDQGGRPLVGVEVKLSGAGAVAPVLTSGDGIFRVLRVPPGMYQLTLTTRDGAAVERQGVEVHAGEVLSIEVHLPVAEKGPVSVLGQKPADVLDEGSYRELSRRPDADGAIVAAPIENILPDEAYFQPRPDRWNAEMPNYHRYNLGDETPFVLGHWYDPFNRNRLKADKPLIGKTFFSFTADSITALEGKRLPTAAGQSTVDAIEPDFFGRGGQFFLAQTFRFSFDLFHGDTSAFRPVDWRIRITPAANINYLQARENQVVSPIVTNGTTRLDGHVGLQEAFGEVKIHDFGPNYDFLNFRAGIQAFVSDFRGFIFADEQPGARLFGNLKSNRFQYNLAAFDLLEKDTNSGLNTFHRRGREVAVANIFIQDFFAKGYTAQFSYHFQRDNDSLHFNDNGVIVRPAPIGTIEEHRIDADYFGWTGDGHLGKLNVTHAFYETLGHDTLNQIAAQKTGINAQLAAVELSVDRDYLRFRTSFLFSSGDGKPRDNTARGFSSIVDGVAFAGGEFSFFNREGIPLARAGVALTAPDSFLPDLRSSKDEGQSNFVNPGIFLYNVGADADLLPTLKLVVNTNFMQFDRTEPLEFLLQQNGLRRTIGVDSGIGFIYRPFLNDNVILHAGATDLVPLRGLRDIYTSQTLVSVFGVVRFQF